MDCKKCGGELQYNGQEKESNTSPNKTIKYECGECGECGATGKIIKHNNRVVGASGAIKKVQAMNK